MAGLGEHYVSSQPTTYFLSQTQPDTAYLASQPEEVAAPGAGSFLPNPADDKFNTPRLEQLKTLQAQWSSGASDLNTPVGGVSRQQLAMERRVAWLEEDVTVLHRRLRDECGDGSSTGGATGASGDQGLRALVARLDGELAAERRRRESLEARLEQMERSLTTEQHEREAQLRGFSSELESTMRDLISRIDQGLTAGAAAMRERTDQTEARIRSLIGRIDEGLTAGAVALQDTLNDAAHMGVHEEPPPLQHFAVPAPVPMHMPVVRQVGAAVRSASPVREFREMRTVVPSQPMMPARSSYIVTGPPMQPQVPTTQPQSADRLLLEWDGLRQENQRLREQKWAQLNTSNSFVVGSASSSLPEQNYGLPASQSFLQR